jgi:hypothetical protein
MAAKTKVIFKNELLDTTLMDSITEEEVTVYIEDDTLLRDDYIEFSQTYLHDDKNYMPRDNTLIKIHYSGRQWEGTIAQLAEKLQII